MTFSQTAQISTTLILYLSCFVLPGFAQSKSFCNADELLRDSSSDLAGYEKLEKPSPGKSAAGRNVEYYYSRDALKAIKAVYYGETGKVEFQYYFATPTTYVAKFAEYYYSGPIHRAQSQVVTTFKGDFVVCHGERPHGYGDGLVVRYRELTTQTLEELLAAAPRR